MKKEKRLIAGILTLAMTIPLAACGNDSTSVSSSTMDKNHVYKEEALSFDVDMDNIDSSFIKGDRIYFVSSIYPQYNYDGVVYDEVVYGYRTNSDNISEEEEFSSDLAYNDASLTTSSTGTTSVTTVDGKASVDEAVVVDDDMSVDDDTSVDEDASIDEDMGVDEDVNIDEDMSLDYQPITYIITSFLLDGTDKKETSFKTQSDSEYYGYFSADNDENVYYMKTISMSTEDEDGNWNYTEEYYLNKIDMSGNSLWEVKLSDYYTATDYFYPYQTAVKDDGQYIVLYTNGLMVFNQDGSFVKSVESLTGYDTFYIMSDGTLLLSMYGDNGQEYHQYDMDTDTLSDALTMPKDIVNYSFYPGRFYDLYLSGNNGIYGYNLNDTEITELLNFVDSDINTGYVNSVLPVTETQFIISYTDYSDYTTTYSLVDKVNPEDVKDKTVITLACYYLDTDIREKVVDFNKTNSEYRITVTDYSEYDYWDEATSVYTSGTTQFNTDLIAGNVPDIVIINSDLQMQNYQNKGLFTDLYALLDEDEELSRDDFMTNILEAYEYDGKLYQLVPQFNVTSAIGKTSDVGTESGWTLDDLNALLETKPDGTAVFSEVTRDDIINYCMTLGSSQFINWNTGECSFDSEGFVKFLEFANTFPEAIDWDSIYNDPEYWEQYETQYLTGDTLLSYLYLSDFSSYTRYRQVTFGEDVTIIGFPTADKNGSIINSYSGFAISAKSKYKDGAWSFVRQFFMEDYQNSITYGWPIRMSAYDALIETAQSRPYYMDENGNKVEYDQTYWINDVEMVVTPCTDEDIDHVMTFLKSLSQVGNNDYDLINIITEEAASYFSGQKSAQDVASVIQSRVNLYVNETR